MVRPPLLKSIRSLIDKVQDFYYYRAAAASGFLSLVLILRFGVLLILVTSFGLLRSENQLSPQIVSLTPWFLWLYFYYILGLLFLAILQPDRFESQRTQVIQVVFDGAVITYFYWTSSQPNSYLFLLYFLPLLVIARFFDLKAVGMFLLLTFITSLVNWATSLKPENFYSPQFWFLNLLPQYGFLFILTLFYLIYYRRRTMSGRLPATGQELEAHLNHFWLGWFSVDSNLRVNGMNADFSQRQGQFASGATCAEVFCRRALPSGEFCSSCPLKQVLVGGEPVEKREMQLTDRYGTQYPARVTAQPIWDQQHQPTGATIWLQDLAELKSFEQKQRSFTEDLERVIDQNRQEDRARMKRLAQQLDAISQASEAAISGDLLRGADEIVQAIVSLLNCRVALVRQLKGDQESGRQGLALCNFFGLDPKDADQINFLELDSSSLVIKTFLTGEDQCVEDLFNSHQLQFYPILRRYSLRSMACFPLIAQGKPIGTFSLFRNRRQGFSQDELRLGRALANNLATLIASQRQLAHDRQEAQVRQQELEVLDLLSQKLVSIESRPMLAQLVADTVLAEIHAETAAVFLKEDSVLHRVSIAGIEADWFEDESYQVGAGLTGQAALPQPGERYGQPIQENAVEQSAWVVPDNLARYKEKLASAAVSHLFALPLNGLEGTFGVLRVVNKLTTAGELDPQGFTEQDVRLMTTIACMVAVAMEKARLFEQEKKKRLLEQALRQGARSLSSMLDEEQILENILDLLKQVVRYDTASLFLQGKDGLQLKSLAGFSREDELQLCSVRLDPDTNLPYQHMLATHQPVLVSDLWQEPLLDRIIGTRSIRSWIGAPLIFKDQVLGWLAVDNWKPNQYTQEDAEIVQAFAQQAAIVINNARQYQFQREQAGFLMKLEQSLVTISSAVDKKETMNRVAQAASQLMSCEMAGVALYDQEVQEIYALPDAGFTGVPEDYVRSFRFPLLHSGGRVLREKKVFTSDDAVQDQQSIFGQRLIEAVGARGVIAAPLLVGEHVVGILYSASHSFREWTNSTRAFFSILANHSAIAIRNAELLDSRKRRAQLLDLLSHLSIAGQLTNDLEVIYNILLTAVTAEYGLRFNRAMILLYSKERNSLLGFTGIGQMDNTEAHRIWEGLDERSHSFDGYIQDVLARGILHYTTLHFKSKNLEIPIRADSNEVFSRVFRSGKLFVVNPTNEGEIINSDFYHLFEPGPFVLAPLVVNGDVVGMLVADNKITGEPIRMMEEELLESCASQAAAAVYRSNLHKQVEERVHVMEHFQELAQAFSELAEPREVLSRIVQATNEVLHADIAYLAPYDYDRDELLVEEAVTAGAKTDFQHEGTFSKHGLTALAMQEPSGLVVIEDLVARKDLSSRFAESEGIRSVAVCKLELRKKIVGMLYVNYRRSHWFSEFELNTLRMLAGQAAVAISNAHLLQQNESHVTRRERSRLRDDLHDVLNIFAFKIMEPAESIYEKERDKIQGGDPQLIEESEELWRFSRHTYQQLVRILEDMNDPILVEKGLPEAIRSLVASSKLPGVELTIHGEARPSADVELALYRICQEAISNIHKHARLPDKGSDLVWITLDLETSQSCLEVVDRGVGFTTEIVKDRRKGIGLQALRNWTRRVGGQIDIQPNPGKGTRIRVVVPQINKQGNTK